MKFSIVAVLSAVVSTVYAQAADANANAGVAINLPSFGQTVTAGQPFTITWTVLPNPSTNINTIALRTGASSALEVLIPNILASPIPVNPPQYVWNIPANVPTNSAYALALTGDNGAITYSSYFTIIGAPAGTSNMSFPAPAASSGAPAASGSVTTPSGSASASGASSTPNKPNSASTLKTGAACIAGVAGAVALLL